MPASGSWNQQLVLYARSFLPANESASIPENELTLPDGTNLPSVFNQLGYAFAVSSYRSTGLAILPALEDLKELVDIAATRIGQPTKIYLTGASEGALVAALSLEKYPKTYSGALAACGPIGSFREQINHIGDSRVLFDYFFPGVIPGSATAAPPEVSANWDSQYAPAVGRALAANASAARQFLNVSLIPSSPDPAVTAANVTAVLKYSVIALRDAQTQLKGQPFDNHERIYLGSGNDLELNRNIVRYTAEPAALAAMKPYETSGTISVPMVTLHTISDSVVPWYHEPRYFIKVAQSGSAQYLTQIPVFRNGHCNFEAGDVVFAFGVMLLKTATQQRTSLLEALPLSQQEQFQDRMRRVEALESH